MTSTAIVNKVWNFCHTLRDDGVGYGDYLEQRVTVRAGVEGLVVDVGYINPFTTQLLKRTNCAACWESCAACNFHADLSAA